MEKQYEVTTDGQSLTGTDINLMSANGALADDRVLAELLQMRPGAAGLPAKGIIPYTHSDAPGASFTTPTCVVRASGSADARTHVLPFRAVIAGASLTDKDENFRGYHSARHVGEVTGNNYRTEVFHPPPAAANRWDLIYATVTVNAEDASVNRAVKSINGTVDTSSIVTSRSTAVSINLLQGAESGPIPTRPALPADSGDNYNIPLAYVFILNNHTSTSTLNGMATINEVAPILGLGGAASSFKPSTLASTYPRPNGNDLTGINASRSDGVVPPSMCGTHERLIVIDPQLDDGGVLLDDSIDWRNRLLRVTISGARSVAQPASPWNGGDAFDGGLASFDFIAHTFGSVTTNHLNLDENDLPGLLVSGEDLVIYADAATGNLRATLINIEGNGVCLFAFIRATGQHGNVVAGASTAF